MQEEPKPEMERHEVNGYDVRRIDSGPWYVYNSDDVLSGPHWPRADADAAAFRLPPKGRS